MNIIAAVILAIMIAGCGEGGAKGIKGTKENPMSTTANGFGMSIYTTEHDGHLWVTRDRGGIVHHPDCPCIKKDKDGR